MMECQHDCQVCQCEEEINSLSGHDSVIKDIQKHAHIKFKVEDARKAGMIEARRVLYDDKGEEVKRTIFLLRPVEPITIVAYVIDDYAIVKDSIDAGIALDLKSINYELVNALK